MIKILLTTGLILTIILASVIGIYNYMPLKYLDYLSIDRSLKLGATITSIAGTDTISSSRTTINTNFTNLNNDKIEVSTTTLPFLITLSNLTTVGTITSGTWNGTAIAVNKGGTGTTSPSIYQVMLGNGSNGLTVASSTGTSGQFLTSNGANAYPSWQTSSIDQTANYNWTGTNLFKNLNASSTAANPIVLNGLSLNTPSSHGASSTVLATDGSGSFTWASYSRKLAGTITDATKTNDTSELVILSIPIIANTFSNSSTIHIRAYISDYDIDTQASAFSLKFGTSYLIFASSTPSATISNSVAFIDLYVTGGTLATQESNSVWATSTSQYNYGSSSVDLSGGGTLQFIHKFTAASANNSITIGNAWAELIQ